MLFEINKHIIFVYINYQIIIKSTVRLYHIVIKFTSFVDDEINHIINIALFIPENKMWCLLFVIFYTFIYICGAIIYCIKEKNVMSILQLSTGTSAYGLVSK